MEERPVIRRIGYRGIKSISEADIENAYKENKITLSVETWFDPEKLTRAANVVEELLAAHGHQSATVEPTYERTASSNVVTVLFTIDEGPKANLHQTLVSAWFVREIGKLSAFIKVENHCACAWLGCGFGDSIRYPSCRSCRIILHVRLYLDCWMTAGPRSS